MAVDDKLRPAAAGGGDHRQTAGHCLKDNVGERIVEGRQQQAIGHLIERQRLRLHAEEAHPRFAAETLRQRLIARLIFIFANHQQIAIGRGDGADRRRQPFTLKAGADVNQAGRLQRQLPFGA